MHARIVPHPKASRGFGIQLYTNDLREVLLLQQWYDQLTFSKGKPASHRLETHEMRIASSEEENPTHFTSFITLVTAPNPEVGCAYCGGIPDHTMVSAGEDEISRDQRYAHERCLRAWLDAYAELTKSAP